MENSGAGQLVQEESIAGSIHLITINELLQVSLMGDPSATSYYCRVSNIQDGKIVITWPTKQGTRLPVHRDQVLELSFVRDGLPYIFSGLVDRTGLTPLPQITVIPKSSISQTQRRENFRVKCRIPVELLGNLEAAGDSGGNTQAVTLVRTSTFDLSAGGFSFRYPKGIPENSILEARIAIPDKGPVIKVPCQVAHLEIVQGRTSLYHVGMHYLAISEQERARIVRFLYRLQLKSLQA